MDRHEHCNVEFTPPAACVVVCSCGWRSASVTSSRLAGQLWNEHAQADRGVVVASARAELYADLVTAVKVKVRNGDHRGCHPELARIELLAEVLGPRELKLACAIRRQIEGLSAEATPSERATVIVGLVELADRARVALERNLPVARRRAPASAP